MLAQRVPQPAARELPLGLRVVHQLGQRDPGPERLVDARRRGEQGVAVDGAGPTVRPLLRPGDAAERQLHRHDPVQRAAHRRPAPGHERRVAAYQPVVPDGDGEVRRHVGLAAGVLDLAGDVLHRPASRRAAAGQRPREGALRRGVLAGDRQRHRGLEVVPDVGVLPRRPRDGAVGLLHGHDRRRRRLEPRRGRDGAAGRRRGRGRRAGLRVVPGHPARRRLAGR